MCGVMVSRTSGTNGTTGNGEQDLLALLARQFRHPTVAAMTVGDLFWLAASTSLRPVNYTVTTPLVTTA